MTHLFSARSKLLVLRTIVLALLLSQISLSTALILNYGASTAKAMPMAGTQVKYLNLFLPNGTQGYQVTFPYQSQTETSQCVKDGITTQKWDKTMFTIYKDPLAGGSQVTIRAFTTNNCSDNPPSLTFRLPYNPTTDTCRLNLLNTRVNGCTSTIIISVDTMLVWPPANGTAVKFIYNKKPNGHCQDTKPLSWGDNNSNTFKSQNSVNAGSTIRFIAYEGSCKQLGKQLVDLSFTVPNAGTAKNSVCSINLQQQPNGSISGCTNGF